MTIATDERIRLVSFSEAHDAYNAGKRIRSIHWAIGWIEKKSKFSFVDEGGVVSDVLTMQALGDKWEVL